MLNKLQAVANRYEELCAKSERPDFYADPKKAAALLREKNDLEPIIAAFEAYNAAVAEMNESLELMSDPDMKEFCQESFQEAKEAKETAPAPMAGPVDADAKTNDKTEDKTNNQTQHDNYSYYLIIWYMMTCRGATNAPRPMMIFSRLA